MLTNTLQTVEASDLNVIAALDAAEEGNTSLMIGMPCTVSINCDSYAAKIVKISASGKTVVVVTDDSDREMTFRATKQGLRCKKYFHLTIGQAITKYDHCF